MDTLAPTPAPAQTAMRAARASFGVDRQRDWALETRRLVEGLGEHQPVVRLGRCRMLRGKPHGEAFQHLPGPPAQGAAQPAGRIAARRIAAEEVAPPCLVRRVALAAL